MMMMAVMMICSWPPNHLNLCHYYPKYMMSNHQMMTFQTLHATGEIPMNILLTQMLNAHLAHELKLTGLPSTHSPTPHLSNLQPRHSSLALVFTAPMISNLPWNQFMSESPSTSIWTQLSSPLATLPHGNPTSYANSNNLICSPNPWILIPTPTYGAALPSPITSFAPATRTTSTPRSKPSGPMGRTHEYVSMHYRSKTLTL